MRYLQLAHNEWDASSKSSKMKVLCNFGRAEDLDRAAVQRLIASLTRLLGDTPGRDAAGDDDAGGQGGGLPGLAFIESRPLGGAYVLDAVWGRLGVAKTMRSLLGTTRRDAVTERVLFALVANRALAPSSKLAAAGWVTHDVHIQALPETTDDACYRAMDWLLEVEPVLTKDVYASVADLLNLEVDLLFFDTTSTYFETEVPDEPLRRDAKGRPIPTGDSADGETDGEDLEPGVPVGAVKQTGR